MGQSVHQENGTYGVTKHLLHTEEGPGRVRRVTAAVVVNDRSVMEGAGKLEHLVWKPRSADEMRRLEELARAAVGFDAKRGDQVAMENVSFSSNSPEVKPPVMERADGGGAVAAAFAARTGADGDAGSMRCAACVAWCCGLWLDR